MLGANLGQIWPTSALRFVIVTSTAHCVSGPGRVMHAVTLAHLAMWKRKKKILSFSQND